jgi:L-ornithine Nalpha-acyltransferase
MWSHQRFNPARRFDGSAAGLWARKLLRETGFPARGAEVVRDLGGLPAVLGRLGSLELRLATTRKDIRRAQKLRYKVFFEEMSAVPSAAARLSRRDKDAYDRICDHLLVIDHQAPPKRPGGKVKPRVVGTYRVLRQEVAERSLGFYTANEFAIGPVIAANRDKRFLELGRSCVLKPYRNKRTIELLWHGIWAYVLHHRIDVMIGCASFEGTDPKRFSSPFGFLARHAGAKDEWRMPALAGRGVPLDDGVTVVDPKAALLALPPLIKGYLRLGATFGPEAVIDPQFGATDVLVILKVADIDRRYIEHYGADAGRYAA